MDESEARIEIQEWLRLSAKKNIYPRTVIFPRNQVGHIDLFGQYDFICYRGEELMPDIYSIPLFGKILKRYHRQISSFTVSKVYDLPELDRNGLVNLPSTQHLFGYDRRLKVLIDTLRLNKLAPKAMLRGVRKAADQKKVVHVRAHPCDFKSDQDFDMLRYLFEHVYELIEQGSLRSLGMAELASSILKTGDNT